jgi:hypothetical protein
MTERLRIGDQVIWRGAWGTQAPLRVRVEAIDAVEPGEKYGTEVTEMAWTLVREDRAVVSLDNGHWAYGSQLAPVQE